MIAQGFLTRGDQIEIKLPISLLLHSHAKCFFGNEPQVLELQRIGKMLNKRGGIDLMRAAHADFSSKCNILGAARNLEYRWDGIGDWRG